MDHLADQALSFGRDWTDAPVNQQDSQGVWRALGEVVLILALFFIHAGYPVPDVNEPHYLCKAKHYWDAAWCSGDFFLDSADAHQLFYWMFGWITRFIALANAAWIGRVATWCLLAWAWQRLSWRFLPRPLFSVLTAGLFVALNYRAELAGEWVVGGIEAKGFAYVLVLHGLERAFAGRWNWAWLCLGGAAAFHILVGGWAAIALGMVWLASGRNQIRFQTMLPGLLGGAFVSLAGFVPALILTWGQPADLTYQANQIYVFQRLPHHLALLHLPPAETAQRLFRHAALFGVLGFLWWQTNRRLAGQVRYRQLVQFATAAASIAVLGLVTEVVTWGTPEMAARILRYYWFRLTDFATPCAVALLTGTIIAHQMQKPGARHLVCLVLACGFVGWHLGTLMRERHLEPIPRCDRPLAYQIHPSRAWDTYVDWVAICHEAAARTRTDAIFLTPLQAQSFKWRTGRAEVVTRKDIPQDATGIVEWSRRCQAIHCPEGPFGEHTPYRSLAASGTSHIAKLARRFEFDYVLTRSTPVLHLPIVCQNESFTIYQVPRYLRPRSFWPSAKPDPNQLRTGY